MPGRVARDPSTRLDPRDRDAAFAPAVAPAAGALVTSEVPAGQVLPYENARASALRRSRDVRGDSAAATRARKRAAGEPPSRRRTPSTLAATSLAGNVGDAVPTFGTDVLGLVKAFVPAPFAPFVDPLIAVGASQVLPQLEASAQTGIKTGLAIAIARIDALLD